MSKVKIQGNASGTGIFTVAAPATNTDRTLTLPDTSSTLLAPDSTGSIQLDYAGSNNYLKFISSSNYVGRNSSTGDIWLNAQGGQSVILGINDTTQLKVDGNGRVIMPNQPAFWVAKNNGNASNGSDIVYNDIKLNRGSCYNSSNGRFTAPISGAYFFTASGINGATSNTFIEIQMYLNGGAALSSRGYYSGSTVGGATVAGVINMTAGDYLTVRPLVTDMYGGESRTGYFTGYLIG